jgi:hypothetical protein
MAAPSHGWWQRYLAGVRLLRMEVGLENVRTKRIRPLLLLPRDGIGLEKVRTKRTKSLLPLPRRGSGLEKVRSMRTNRTLPIVAAVAPLLVAGRPSTTTQWLNGPGWKRSDPRLRPGMLVD